MGQKHVGQIIPPSPHVEGTNNLQTGGRSAEGGNSSMPLPHFPQPHISTSFLGRALDAMPLKSHRAAMWMTLASGTSWHSNAFYPNSSLCVIYPCGRRDTPLPSNTIKRMLNASSVSSDLCCYSPQQDDVTLSNTNLFDQCKKALKIEEATTTVIPLVSISHHRPFPSGTHNHWFCAITEKAAAQFNRFCERF